MYSKITEYIKEHNIRIVLVDVDGTLKDLAGEHMMTVQEMVRMRASKKTIEIYNIIIYINAFLMWFVKTGLLPTNENMQIVLCFINSFMFGESFQSFKEEYIKEYSYIKKIFKGSYDLLDDIQNAGAKYILVSKNKQSINFFEEKPIFERGEIIICCSDKSKLSSFVQAIYSVTRNREYTLLSEQILIIGDNFWDDVIPAKDLGARVIWCNKYNSRLKAICNYFLCKKFYKKAANNTGENTIW